MMDSLVFYSKIQRIKKEYELLNSYPNLKAEIDQLFGNNLINIKKNLFQTYNFNSIKNNQFVFLGRPILISFLRHFRNAIAHCNIIVDEVRSLYIISDYTDGSKKERTCYGLIEPKEFKKLLQIVKTFSKNQTNK